MGSSRERILGKTAFWELIVPSLQTPTTHTNSKPRIKSEATHTSPQLWCTELLEALELLTSTQDPSLQSPIPNLLETSPCLLAIGSKQAIRSYFHYFETTTTKCARIYEYVLNCYRSVRISGIATNTWFWKSTAFPWWNPHQWPEQIFLRWWSRSFNLFFYLLKYINIYMNYIFIKMFSCLAYN